MEFSAGSTDGWREAAENLGGPRVFSPPPPKTVPEEVKLDVRVAAPSVAVLAVNDLGLGRMDFEPTLRQSSLERAHYQARFLFAPAVHKAVVRIPAPREFRVCSRHPEVEGIVQEEIGKYRADDAPLRGSARSLDQLSIPFHGCCQPSFDVE